jgi:hypothetical protein
VLLAGAVLLARGLGRSSQLAPLPSAAVAYEVLLPLGALGLGLALLVSFILYFLVISVMNRRRA